MSDAAPVGSLAYEYLPDISQLAPDHQASFRIGQMMRLTVELEQNLRSVHSLLSLHDQPLDAPKKLFQSLADQISAAIGTSHRCHHLAESSRLALEHIKSVYRRRNRFAHDLYIYNGVDRWTQVSVEGLAALSHTRDIGLSDMREAVLDVVSARWRADGLHNVIYRTLRQRAADRSTNDQYIDERWLAIVDGRFELTAGGGVRITARL